ncbi:5313_t:CDS:1, partial [Racocetra persica]
ETTRPPVRTPKTQRKQTRPPTRTAKNHAISFQEYQEKHIKPFHKNTASDNTSDDTITTPTMTPTTTPERHQLVTIHQQRH